MKTYLSLDTSKVHLYTEEEIRRIDENWSEVYEEQLSEYRAAAAMRAENIEELRKILKKGSLYGKDNEKIVSKVFPALAYPSKRTVNYVTADEVPITGHGGTPLSAWKHATAHADRIKKKQIKENILIEKAYSLATTKYPQLLGQGLSSDTLIEAVTDLERREIRKELVASSEEMDCNCDECSTYTAGEHRCSCGNRRIEILFEGNIVSGLTPYASAY